LKEIDLFRPAERLQIESLERRIEDMDRKSKILELSCREIERQIKIVEAETAAARVESAFHIAQIAGDIEPGRHYPVAPVN
jgi:hypothetical protein